MPDPLEELAALPGVADAVERARDAVDRLRGHRVLRRAAPAVAAEASLRGARAAALLELGRADADGWPLETVRAAARSGVLLDAGGTGVVDDTGGEGPARETAAGVVDDTGAAGPAGMAEVTAPDRAVLRGALRVAAELGPARAAWQRAPLQALARLHVVAGAGLLPPDVLGRPRSTGPDTAHRLVALAGLVSAPTRAPALVVAAVAHGELLALRPFGALDGLVALAAQRLVLVTRGLDPRSLTAPEVGHLGLGAAAYADALAGYRSAGPAGVAAWVQHVGEAVVLGAREGLAVCEAVQRGA